MPKVVIKDLKRCPSCHSSKIYPRVRAIKQKGRKANKNFIEERVKHYRCLDCKYEFDNPIVDRYENRYENKI